MPELDRHGQAPSACGESSQPSSSPPDKFRSRDGVIGVGGGDGETQLEADALWRASFFSRGLGAALLVRSDAAPRPPKHKEWSSVSFRYQVPGPCLWVRSNLTSRIRPTYTCQSSFKLSPWPYPGEHDIADARNPLDFFREHKACPTYTTRSASQPFQPCCLDLAQGEILTRHSGSRINEPAPEVEPAEPEGNQKTCV